MKKDIGLKETISIAIGGMVGGGIFAVLGLAVTLAGGATPVAFAVAGLITLMTCYSYSKLSVCFPDEGGTVRFINEGFGPGIFAGGVNNLLWVSYIIMLSLYSSAFGSYAPNLISISGDLKIDSHIFITAIILFALAINYYSIAVVGKIESISVGLKLVILISFVFIGLWGINNGANFDQLNPVNWESPLKIVAGGMVIFVAYEGFELIANAAPDIRNPQRNIPRAYFGSVLFVILLYILIATVTVGSLPFSTIYTAQDYVLAEAAKPKLGQAGFTIITIAALISTFSAINATLLGGTRVNYEIAEDNELPKEFTKIAWGHPVGLAFTALATLIFANFLNLESISTSGSLGFLLIFCIVNIVAVKKANLINGVWWIPAIAALLCGLAFVVLCNEQWHDNRIGLYVAFSIIVLCFIGEILYKRLS